MRRLLMLLLALSITTVGLTSATALGSTHAISGPGNAPDNADVPCGVCGKILNGTTGQQSEIAKSLGLTLCMNCWLQKLWGNDNTPLAKTALLGVDGLVLPVQLPVATSGVSSWGQITGSLGAQTDLTQALATKLTTPPLVQGYLYYNGSAFVFQAVSGGSESEQVIVKAGDTANTTVNLASDPNLTFTADANSTYIIEVWLVWSASLATVGLKVSATATNTPTIQCGRFDSDAVNGTTDSSSWNANDVTLTTSGSAFTANNLGKVDAVLRTGASASVWTLRFAAETTGTITTKAGSVLRYRKVG
jgi:hypothetical protein